MLEIQKKSSPCLNLISSYLKLTENIPLNLILKKIFLAKHILVPHCASTQIRLLYVVSRLHFSEKFYKVNLDQL